MLEAGLLALPIAIAVALAAAIVVLGRQAQVTVSAVREATQGRAAIADLAGRADAILVRAVEPLDALRRGSISAQAIAGDLEAVERDLETLEAAASDVRVPGALAGTLRVIREELGRSGRALAMAEHGRVIMTSARLRGRELEAGTSVKRGYLNLLHARESIRLAADRAAAWRAPEERRRR